MYTYTLANWSPLYGCHQPETLRKRWEPMSFTTGFLKQVALLTVSCRACFLDSYSGSKLWMFITPFQWSLFFLPSEIPIVIILNGYLVSFNEERDYKPWDFCLSCAPAFAEKLLPLQATHRPHHTWHEPNLTKTSWETLRVCLKRGMLQNSVVMREWS